jgi:hypothetical protein
VIALISGGGSSLLVAPAPGLSLADKQAINTALLRSGATISEMNCLRRHLSALKGGRLGAACHPAQLLTLLISDVPGDDPIDIASGPTVGDPTTCADALAIVERYRIDLPPAARALLESGAGESVKPADPRLVRAQTRIVTAPQMALEAAAQVARAAGVQPYILGHPHARARQRRHRRQRRRPGPPAPCCPGPGAARPRAAGPQGGAGGHRRRRAGARYGVPSATRCEAHRAGSWVHERLLQMPEARGLDGLPMATVQARPRCRRWRATPSRATATPTARWARATSWPSRTTVQCVAGVTDFAVQRIKAELLPRTRTSTTWWRWSTATAAAWPSTRPMR